MSDTTTAIIIAALSGSGLSAIVAAVIAALSSKRKLGAEATEIITKAAAGVVTNIQADYDRQVAINARRELEHAEEMRECRESMEAMAASHAAEMEEVRRVLQLHVAWDAIAIAKMADFDIELPPAPPLLPARRFDHPQP